MTLATGEGRLLFLRRIAGFYINRELHNGFVMPLFGFAFATDYAATRQNCQ